MAATTGVRTIRMETKRAQIRAGARRLFLHRGFAGASTDAIAAEAGVSKQTLYAYYPSKEELFEDVLRQMTVDSPQSPFAHMDGASPESPAALHRILHTLAQSIIAVSMQPEYLALVRTIIAEASRFPQLSTLFRATVPEQAMRSIAMLLDQARANGVIQDGNFDAMARMFVGSLLTYTIIDGLFLGDEPPRPPDAERIRELVDLYMNVVK